VNRRADKRKTDVARKSTSVVRTEKVSRESHKPHINWASFMERMNLL